MVKRLSKYIENKCSHRAFRPILIGKMPIAKEILDMFEFSLNQKNTFSID